MPEEKKAWVKPMLTVLTRGEDRQEMVLEGCKWFGHGTASEGPFGDAAGICCVPANWCALCSTWSAPS